MKRRYNMKFKAYTIAAMLIFGSIGLFVRGINLPYSEIALFRGIIGSTFLLLSMALLKNSFSWKAVRSNMTLLLLSGAAIGANWIFLFEAYKYTTISTATLCYYCAPVIVIMLSPLILKEKLSGLKIACVFASLQGMSFVAGINNLSGGGQNNLLGIACGLIAAVLYASVMLMNKFLKGLSGIESSSTQLLIASAVLLPYVLLTEKVSFSAFTGNTILLILVVGIVHTGIAYLLYFSAMQKLPGQTIALFSYIDPITAIILSSLILGEVMNPLQILGAFLILGSTCISELYETRKSINASVN
jgi:RarD protein